MSEKRDKFISMRLTQNEYDKLKELAYLAKISVSEYIRKLIFNAEEDNNNGLLD